MSSRWTGAGRMVGTPIAGCARPLTSVVGTRSSRRPGDVSRKPAGSAVRASQRSSSHRGPRTTAGRVTRMLRGEGCHGAWRTTRGTTERHGFDATGARRSWSRGWAESVPTAGSRWERSGRQPASTSIISKVKRLTWLGSSTPGSPCTDGCWRNWRSASCCAPTATARDTSPRKVSH